MSKYAVMPLSDYDNACDKIREKTETAEPIKSGEFAGKVEDVYNEGLVEGIEQGAVNEKKRWWGIYQENGNRTDCANMFSGKGWNDQTFAPLYDITIGSNPLNGYMTFRYCGVADIEKALKDNGVKIVINGGDLQLTFNSMMTQILGEIYFNAPITAMMQTFAYSNYLQEIRSALLVTESTIYSSAFEGCGALKEVRFIGTIGQNGLNFQWSTKLSRASFISVFKALSDSTSGLSATFSKTAVEAAFSTEEWEALKATKPNWTINLV